MHAWSVGRSHPSYYTELVIGHVETQSLIESETRLMSWKKEIMSLPCP